MLGTAAATMALFLARAWASQRWVRLREGWSWPQATVAVGYEVDQLPVRLSICIGYLLL